MDIGFKGIKFFQDYEEFHAHLYSYIIQEQKKQNKRITKSEKKYNGKN